MKVVGKLPVGRCLWWNFERSIHRFNRWAGGRECNLQLEGDLVDNYAMRVPNSRRALLLALLLVLLCSAVSGQPSPQAGSVRGTVYLADTAGPAKGAIVSLLPSSVQQGPVTDQKTGELVVKDQPHRRNFHSTTDANGSFEIGDVKPGSYYVLTFMPEYLSQDDYIYPGALSQELNPGASTPPFVQQVNIDPGAVKQVALHLVCGGQIEGTVRFADGKPAHNGEGIFREIALSLEMRSSNGKFTRFGGAAHTDSDGRFHFDGLPPASYVVFAALPGETVTTKRGLSGSGGEVIFCCNSVRTSKARLIEIHGTEVHDHVDFNLPTSGLHAVTGSVLTTTGEQIDEGIVRLYPSGEPDLSRATPVRIDGAFSFKDVPDEDYTVSFEIEGHAEYVGPTPDKTGIVMRMRQPPFKSVRQEIKIAGDDPSPIILRTVPLPGSESSAGR
jgi:hypothetical protein